MQSQTYEAKKMAELWMQEEKDRDFAANLSKKLDNEDKDVKQRDLHCSEREALEVAKEEHRMYLAEEKLRAEREAEDFKLARQTMEEEEELQRQLEERITLKIKSDAAFAKQLQGCNDLREINARCDSDDDDDMCNEEAAFELNWRLDADMECSDTKTSPTISHTYFDGQRNEVGGGYIVRSTRGVESKILGNGSIFDHDLEHDSMVAARLQEEEQSKLLTAQAKQEQDDWETALKLQVNQGSICISRINILSFNLV
jgi:hypothetical protein